MLFKIMTYANYSFVAIWNVKRKEWTYTTAETELFGIVWALQILQVYQTGDESLYY